MPAQVPLDMPEANFLHKTDIVHGAGNGMIAGALVGMLIGAIVVFLGVVLFLVRNNVNADDLAVGDCFNIPNGTTISTVEKQPCTETHNAEVIFIGEYTGDTYPISLSLDSYLQDNEGTFQVQITRTGARR